MGPGDVLTFYLTGIGAISKTFPDGAAPGVAASASAPVSVTVQGMAATVLYAGVQPQYPGLDQITIQLPAYTANPNNAANLSISAGGQTVNYSLPSR